MKTRTTVNRANVAAVRASGRMAVVLHDEGWALYTGSKFHGTFAALQDAEEYGASLVLCHDAITARKLKEGA